MAGRLTGIVTIALGVALLWLAVPRSVAYILLLPGDTASRRLFTDEPITREGYKRLMDSRRAALRWVELPEARIELGGALYLQYLKRSFPLVTAERVLQAARRQLELGLAGAPADPFAWLWLADIRAIQGDEAAAAKALRLSFLTAPRNPNLAIPRVAAALALADNLDAETKRMAAQNVATILTSSEAQSFVGAIVRLGQVEDLRALAAPNSEAGAKLEAILAELQQA